MPRRLADPNDQQIWSEFYLLYKKLVMGFAGRSGLMRADAEEVTQDVFNEVSTNIHAFLGNAKRGSFRGWLLNLTRWRVMDKVRQKQRQQKHICPRYEERGGDPLAALEDLPDTSVESSEILWEKEWELQVFETALNNLRDQVDARHFQAFELHVAKGIPLRKVALQMEINPATIYVIHFRLKRQLQAEVIQLKRRLS